MSRSCQYEVGNDGYIATLCTRPAVILIDRRELGKLALCQQHHTRAAALEIERQRYISVRVG